MNAQLKANETAVKVDSLNEQLGQLQKNFLKNDYDAKEIKSQSDQVREAANNAHESATQVSQFRPGVFRLYTIASILILIRFSFLFYFSCAMTIVRRTFR